MGLSSSFVLKGVGDKRWRGREVLWTAKRRRHQTGHALRWRTGCGDDMSTNRPSYPHPKTPYPHSWAAGPPLGPPGNSQAGSVRVEQLAKRSDVAAEIVVLGHLSLDLLAAMEDRRVVTTAESLADPHEGGLGFFAHEVHRDLSR
jgi:hypothetical protein